MDYLILATCGLIILLTLAVIGWNLFVQLRMSWLSPSPPPAQTFPKISVIIPARNEGQDIVATVHSVLQQQGVDLEMIVVNDHSTDRTGALVEAIVREDSQVTVLHDPPMQSGWLGKANAMQYGAAKATGEYLVFTDADVLHAPLCFASALAVMQHRRYDFFSFSPRWLHESVWEHVNIPIYLTGFLKFLSLPGLDDPASPHAIATGAFMAIKAAVFHETGGFECVKGDMFDDVGLARSLKANRYRVSYWLAPRCSQVRLFKNASDAFWGTTKNILGAVEGHAGLALPLILVAIIQYWTPLYAVIVGSLTGSPLLIIIGLSTSLLQYLSFFSIRRLFKFHPLKLVCFPLVVVVSTCCIVRAVWHQRKGSIFWRGRTIRVK
jgi:chlorobactene glucosyltransferase